MVGIRFHANPVPESNEVIWHHSPMKDDEELPPPPGAFVLEAGQSTEDERFQALELNITDHEVLAILLVNNANGDLLEGRYYLEAFNEHGNAVYDFTFEEYVKDYLYEPTEEPELYEEDVDVDSMSGGSIAAIVIVTLGLVFGIALTLFAKNTNKWCFNSSAKPDYNATATSDPDAGKSQDVRKATSATDNKMENPV